MEYILNENEDFKDFVNRALRGCVVDDLLRMLIFILEIVATEKIIVKCSISIVENADYVTMEIGHQGNALKKNILDIIDDQVDYIYYSEKNKKQYVLKIRKTYIS